MAQNIGILITETYQKKLAPAQAVELWEPGKREVRVKVMAAAQNPVDWKQIDYNFGNLPLPYINGFDAAGVVDKLGEGVTKYKVGDRTAAFSPLGQGAKYGIYQKYNLARVDGSILIPQSLSFDDAATLPTAFWTAAIGLFSLIRFPLPLEGDKLAPLAQAQAQVEAETLLVWGGSSSVGAMAVQLAVASGLRVIATAGKRSFDYVQSLGAEVVLDYHDVDIVDQIKALAPNLRYAYDAISEHGSTESVLSSLAHPASEVALVLPYAGTVPGHVTRHQIMSGAIYVPEQAAELARLGTLWQALTMAGRLIPHPVRVMPRGLDSVDEGFGLARRGEVSGEKIVYRPQETEV
ncbi:GroES-like protein [Calocera cornea HHB12733]|uniref:GroES-like protein n=1 Tax=Calocera cornea HHB12733 TaxID=1353952 RepID=A0A165I343_9BASI|nr:GroES-like protein [Calocera cornea HHB12733]